MRSSKAERQAGKGAGLSVAGRSVAGNWSPPDNRSPKDNRSLCNRCGQSVAVQSLWTIGLQKKQKNFKLPKLSKSFLTIGRQLKILKKQIIF